jgi:hypothetical protein
MPNKPLGSISVNQTPQYGDRKVLENSAKAVKTSPVSGATVPAPKAGRPAGQPTAQSAQGYTVPPEHEALAQRVATATAVRDYWAGVYQRIPSSFARMYLTSAQRDLQQLAVEARNTTPWFE